MRPAASLVLLGLFLPAAQSKSRLPGLFEALVKNGASQFAHVIAADPTAASAKFLLRRDTTTERDNSLQALQSVQDMGESLKPPAQKPAGQVLETVSQNASLNGGNQNVVAAPLNNSTLAAANGTAPGANTTAAPLLGISSGLGNVVQVVKSNIAFRKAECNGSGIIHITDGYFTPPKLLSDTVQTLGLTGFSSLTGSASLTRELDSTPAITVFVPSNPAFGASSSNTSSTAAVGLVKGLIVANFLGYLPNLHDGEQLTTQGGSVLTVTVRGSDVFINGARIIRPNIILYNGVAHVLEKLPESGGSSSPPIVTGEGAPVGSRSMAAVAAGLGAFVLAMFV